MPANVKQQMAKLVKAFDKYAQGPKPVPESEAKSGSGTKSTTPSETAPTKTSAR